MWVRQSYRRRFAFQSPGLQFVPFPTLRGSRLASTTSEGGSSEMMPPLETPCSWLPNGHTSSEDPPSEVVEANHEQRKVGDGTHCKPGDGNANRRRLWRSPHAPRRATPVNGDTLSRVEIILTSSSRHPHAPRRATPAPPVAARTRDCTTDCNATSSGTSLPEPPVPSCPGLGRARAGDDQQRRGARARGGRRWGRSIDRSIDRSTTTAGRLGG